MAETRLLIYLRDARRVRFLVFILDIYYGFRTAISRTKDCRADCWLIAEGCNSSSSPSAGPAYDVYSALVCEEIEKKMKAAGKGRVNDQIYSDSMVLNVLVPGQDVEAARALSMSLKLSHYLNTTQSLTNALQTRPGGSLCARAASVSRLQLAPRQLPPPQCPRPRSRGRTWLPWLQDWIS